MNQPLYANSSQNQSEKLKIFPKQGNGQGLNFQVQIWEIRIDFTNPLHKWENYVNIAPCPTDLQEKSTYLLISYTVVEAASIRY